MNAQELYRWGYQQGHGIAFLTNIIQVNMPKPASKMRKLYKLVQEGKHVESGDMWGTMRVDGQYFWISEILG